MFDVCGRYDTDYHTDVITSRLLMPYVLLSNMINYNITPAHGKGAAAVASFWRRITEEAAAFDCCPDSSSEKSLSTISVVGLYFSLFMLFNLGFGVCPSVQLYTKCALIVLICAVLTANLCSYNYLLCNAT